MVRALRWCALSERAPPSSDLAGLVEGEPRAAGIQAGRIAIAEIADEIRFPGRAGEKGPCNLGVYKAGQRAGVQPEGSSGQDEIGALERAVAHRRGRGKSRIVGEHRL